MTTKRNRSLTISLDLFTAETIVKLDADLSAPDNGDDEFRAESDLADSEMLDGLCEEAIIGGKRSDWQTDRNEVILLAKAMMKIVA